MVLRGTCCGSRARFNAFPAAADSRAYYIFIDILQWLQSSLLLDFIQYNVQQ